MLLTDIVEPSWKKSSTDIEEAKRANPKTEKAEPMRAMLRSAIDDPTWI
jgi:hypothetical protein